MNKRQRKKAVMKSVSKYYDVVFERGRFRKRYGYCLRDGPAVQTDTIDSYSQTRPI